MSELPEVPAIPLTRISGTWVCPTCLAKAKDACVLTVGNILHKQCRACGRLVQNLNDLTMVDAQTYAAIRATTPYRKELEAPTVRIGQLPIHDGWPMPYFVGHLKDGTPEFRGADPEKFVRCVKESRCWVCGQPFEGAELRVFVIGPMCIINRTTAEPPSHEACARWSARNCPFLKNPAMVRRDVGVGKGATEEDGMTDPAGFMIKRNPGVFCLWSTRMFKLFKDGNGGILINIGPPSAWEWWTAGRRAARFEVAESIHSGLPNLLNVCRSEKDLAEVHRRVLEAEKYFPIATT